VKAALGFGFKVGHWTDDGSKTGCTVVLPPPENVASCDVRGSSPGSRELTLLDTDRRLSEVHAILLTGGSAFGLAAADGVMNWLAQRGIGYRTPIAIVPIVPAAVIFDLGSGRSDTRPDATAGLLASEAATEQEVNVGPVGAGAGATVGKWAGLTYAVAGGLGIATVERDEHAVSALAVVNAVGDVIGADGRVIAGTTAATPAPRSPVPVEKSIPMSTVLALVATQGPVDKRDVRWLAQRGSDGITQTIRPAHTRYDGDVTFAVSAPSPSHSTPPDLDVLGTLATDAVAAVIRAAVARP
jgi:L-aminopeptidase/D-esterase-like protein